MISDRGPVVPPPPPYSFGEWGFASRLRAEITCAMLCSPSPISFLGRQWSLQK